MRALPLILAVVLFGCGSPATEDGPIVYERGGGIAGHSFRLEVAPDGTATLDTRQGTEADTVGFTVPGEELDAIRSHLDEADVGSLDEGTDPGCADCYGYGLEYGGDRATADSSTITEEFADATEPLGRLVEENLPPGFEG